MTRPHPTPEAQAKRRECRACIGTGVRTYVSERRPDGRPVATARGTCTQCDGTGREPEARSLPCPDCTGTGKADPHFDDGPDVWTDECAGCWGSGRADELECAGCDRVVSIVCGEDPEPHACDPENPLSYLCTACRLEPEHHHLRCLGGGVLRRVA